MPSPKELVYDYWNRQSCGTNVTRSRKFSREYFEEIEAYRYAKEPEIFSFAQFTRFHGRRVLEVGIGAGSDFLQWVRAGAMAHGIDLTEEAVTNVRERLKIYGLSAVEVRQADAEALPYPDSMFDVVYSWGVLHHTPDTALSLREAVRVLAPGGVMKVMLYNRQSVVALASWLRACLLRGRPWRSISWALAHHLESPGTKAFTAAEAREMLAGLPIRDLRVTSARSLSDGPQADETWQGRAVRRVAAAAARLLWWRQPGWFLLIELRKASGPDGA
jgi:2-polyprenyl-3-methyl-5-hydroxy-6-metoxy-1,4-benzoquinol methylase